MHARMVPMDIREDALQCSWTDAFQDSEGSRKDTGDFENDVRTWWEGERRGGIVLKFFDSVSYVVYPVYCWLGIHNAPVEILDALTICFLVVDGLYGYITRKHKR